VVKGRLQLTRYFWNCSVDSTSPCHKYCNFSLWLRCVGFGIRAQSEMVAGKAGTLGVPRDCDAGGLQDGTETGQKL
jgi:hypothetical protein